MPGARFLLACLAVAACTRTERPRDFAPVRETRDAGVKPGGGGPSDGVAAPADAGAAPAPTNEGLACAELPRPAQAFALADPFPRLPAFKDPTAAVQAPGQPQFWYVAEQAGVLKRFANQPDVSGSTVVLDLTGDVDTEGDAGLLAIAFHPGFLQNGQVFLSYTLKGTPLRSRLSRFTSSDGGARFDPASEQVLIEIPQPDAEKTHLNCDMRFGPDGFLWAGFGDGGFKEDSRGEAQNPGSINGKILRIDVDRPSGGLPYGIPADNPFVGMPGARGEVWALGFRNPWRWRFDPAATGVLWLGDVGSDRREELNRVVRGGNYGWNRLEGGLCLTATCEPTGLSAPHVEHRHAEGKSITAGPVYRGRQLPALQDRLIYGDFVSGHLWALPADRSPRPELILGTQLGLVSFGESLDGELYLVDYLGGRLHQVAPSTAGAKLPTRLSETGCLDRGTATPHLIPYDVNAPLWSDGASKRRWLALPPGGKIGVTADGDFQLPAGSTLVKEFSVGGTRTETRLFVRHADGGWAGYSYGWNAEQTEATLLDLASTAVVRTVGSARWSHPSRYQCMACHTAEAGFSLGLETAQLDRPFKYRDGERNQLAHLQAAGVFASPLPAPAGAVTLPDPEGNAPLEARARAYLHANCSGCHRPNSRTPRGMDLRFRTALRDMRAFCVEADYGGFPGVTRRMQPGQPEASVVSHFMRSTGELRMPPVGTTQVDQTGVGLVEGWVRSTTTCP